MMNNKRHSFKVDANILHSIILKQAGTLEKSFLELTMNSIDAGATKIELDFDGSKFTFFDDGKGFDSEDNIHKFFGTFGTPHNEGDAIYGKFRMGRGQIMAFAQNEWYSNQYYMGVDIKNKGDEYSFANDKDVINGCKITGTLYEELEPYEFKKFEIAFKEYIKFSQIPIYLNGELISEDINDEKWNWDLITDDAYIKIDTKRNLTVYNLGVKVTDYPSYEVSFGGIVVSKKPLEVNFARNDILRKSCPVWKSIQNEINKILKKNIKNDTAELTDEQRAVLSKQFITGEIEYTKGRRLKLFKDVQGKTHSLGKLAKLKESITISSKDIALADKVHNRKLAFVLDLVVLENFGVDSLKSLFKGIKELKNKGDSFYKYDYSFFNNLEDKLIEDITIFNEQIKSHSEIIEDKNLTLKQKLVLEVLNKNSTKIKDLVNKYLSPKTSIRKIVAGKSELADGWTDGKSYIAIEIDFIDESSKGVWGFTKLCNLILHEYIHRFNSSKSHSHDAIFYEAYHLCSQHHFLYYNNDYTYPDGRIYKSTYTRVSNISIGSIATSMTKSYFGLLEKNKIKVPQCGMIMSSKNYKKLFGSSSSNNDNIQTEKESILTL